MSDKILPWHWSDTKKFNEPGMAAYVRTIEFENTGNNEASITWEVAVSMDDGAVLLHTKIHEDRECFTAIDVDFSQDGSCVVLSIQNGEARACPLNAAGLS